MGTRYKTQLYIPIENLAKSLEVLNDLTKLICKKSTIVDLPDGSQIEIAYSHYEQDIERISFDTGRFPNIILPIPLEDNILRKYFTDDEGKIAESSIIIHKNVQYVGYGHLFFGINLGKNYCELYFMTVASSLNKLMLQSSSIHRVMKSILKQAGGEIGLIDTELGTDDFLLAHSIHNPTQLLKIDWRNIPENQLTDFIPEAVKAQLDKE